MVEQLPTLPYSDWKQIYRIMDDPSEFFTRNHYAEKLRPYIDICKEKMQIADEDDSSVAAIEQYCLGIFYTVYYCFFNTAKVGVETNLRSTPHTAHQLIEQVSSAANSHDWENIPFHEVSACLDVCDNFHTPNRTVIGTTYSFLDLKQKLLTALLKRVILICKQRTDDSKKKFSRIGRARNPLKPFFGYYADYLNKVSQHMEDIASDKQKTHKLMDLLCQYDWQNLQYEDIQNFSKDIARRQELAWLLQLATSWEYDHYFGSFDSASVFMNDDDDIYAALGIEPDDVEYQCKVDEFTRKTLDEENTSINN